MKINLSMLVNKMIKRIEEELSVARAIETIDNDDTYNKMCICNLNDYKTSLKKYKVDKQITKEFKCYILEVVKDFISPKFNSRSKIIRALYYNDFKENKNGVRN